MGLARIQLVPSKIRLNKFNLMAIKLMAQKITEVSKVLLRL